MEPSSARFGSAVVTHRLSNHQGIGLFERTPERASTVPACAEANPLIAIIQIRLARV
jgi:hypothetical protein